MTLQKETNMICHEKSKGNNLVSAHRKSGITTAVKGIVLKISDIKYNNIVHNNTETDNPTQQIYFQQHSQNNQNSNCIN